MLKKVGGTPAFWHGRGIAAIAELTSFFCQPPFSPDRLIRPSIPIGTTVLNDVRCIVIFESQRTH